MADCPYLIAGLLAVSGFLSKFELFIAIDLCNTGQQMSQFFTSIFHRLVAGQGERLIYCWCNCIRHRCRYYWIYHRKKSYVEQNFSRSNIVLMIFSPPGIVFRQVLKILCGWRPLQVSVICVLGCSGSVQVLLFDSSSKHLHKSICSYSGYPIQRNIPKSSIFFERFF